MPVRAVLFDLGDTLIFRAHEPDPSALFEDMARRVQPLLDTWRATLPVALPALLADVFRAVETAQPARRAKDEEVDAPFIVRGALATYDVEVSDEQARAFWNATAVGVAAWGWQLYPDARDTLRRLHDLKLQVALVSNSWSTSEIIGHDLASAGIGADLLPVVVSSSDVGRPKPRPEPFLRALAQLGVDATDAAFVGDSLEADVRGAKALAMTTVWKLNGRHEVDPEPEADHMVHDLWEIFTLGLVPAGAGAAHSQESLWPHEDANADRY